MRYRLRIVVRGRDGAKDRDVVTHVAGCVDADDARVKARRYYDVVAFKSVEPIDEKEES